MNSTHERFGGVNAFCLLTTHSGHDQIRREGESKSRIPRDARHLSRCRAAREPHGPAPPIPLVAIEAQLGALHQKSWAVIDRPYSLGCATESSVMEDSHTVCPALVGIKRG